MQSESWQCGDLSYIRGNGKNCSAGWVQLQKGSWESGGTQGSAESTKLLLLNLWVHILAYVLGLPDIQQMGVF